MQEREILAGLGIIFLALILLIVFGHGTMGGFGFGMGWIFWLLILAVIYLFMRQSGKKREQSTEEILKTRLAKGEITPEEYGELRKKLYRGLSSL